MEGGSAADNDYVLHELQPVSFASSNEPEQGRFIKLTSPCTIRSGRVLNSLDNLDEPITFEGGQLTGMHLLTRNSNRNSDSEDETVAALVNPYEIEEVRGKFRKKLILIHRYAIYKIEFLGPLNQHIEECRRFRTSSDSLSSCCSSSENIPLSVLRKKLRIPVENDEENLDTGKI